MPARKKQESDEIQLKVLLKGEMAKKFLKIKQKYGFESNTDLIRLLVSKAYDEMKKEGYIE